MWGRSRDKTACLPEAQANADVGPVPRGNPRRPRGVPHRQPPGLSLLQGEAGDHPCFKAFPCTVPELPSRPANIPKLRRCSLCLTLSFLFSLVETSLKDSGRLPTSLTLNTGTEREESLTHGFRGRPSSASTSLSLPPRTRSGLQGLPGSS